MGRILDGAPRRSSEKVDRALIGLHSSDVLFQCCRLLRIVGRLEKVKSLELVLIVEIGNSFLEHSPKLTPQPDIALIFVRLHLFE